MSLLSNPFQSVGLLDDARRASIIASLCPGSVAVPSSAPVLRVGLTWSRSGVNAVDASLPVTMQLLAELTNGHGGVWMDGVQYQVQLLMADDQSSAAYAQLLYAYLEQQLDVRLFVAPYGDTMIQQLSTHIAASNGTFVVGVGSDPMNYAGNTGNLFDFINTSDLLLRQSLDYINTAAQNASATSRQPMMGIATVCVFTATVDPLLRAQREGLLNWIATENGRRSASAAAAAQQLPADQLIQLVLDVAWPDSSDATTCASYYSLCPADVDLVVALSSGHGIITGLKASQLRPRAALGWTSDPLLVHDFVFIDDGFEHAYNQDVADAAGWIIPVPLDVPAAITVPAQIFATAQQFTPIFITYTAALNLSTTLSTVDATYANSWCTLMAAVNSSASTQRADMRRAVLSLNGQVAMSGLLQVSATSGINEAPLGTVAQCDGAVSCLFRDLQSLPLYPYDWAWHPISPGDRIASTQSPTPILVALVVTVLGVWVAQIIVEQATFVRRRGGRSYLLWLIIATLSLGGVGVWCCMLMQTTALTTSLPGAGQAQSVDWSLAIMLLAWLPSLALTFPGLWLLILDVPTDALSSVEGGAKTAAAPSSTDEEGVDCEREAGLSGGGYLQRLLRWVSWRMVMGGLLLAASVVLTRVTLWYVWRQDAGFRSLAWAWVVSTLVDTTLIPLSTLMFVHALRWRIPAVFLFASGVMADWQVHAASLHFTYATHDSSEVSSPGLSATVVLIIAGLIAAFTCFVFVGLQFHAMKLSRNDLSLLVNRLRVALASQEAQVAQLQKRSERQLRGAQVLSRMLSTINLVTTLPQEYGLPLSLYSGVTRLGAFLWSSAAPNSAAPAPGVTSGELPTGPGMKPNAEGGWASSLQRRKSSLSRSVRVVPVRAYNDRRATAEDRGFESSIISALEAQSRHAQLQPQVQALTDSSLLGRNSGVERSRGGALRSSDSSQLKSLDEANFDLTAPLLGGDGAAGKLRRRDGASAPVTAPSLEMIMSHPVAVEVLKRALQRSQSVESLIFCLHARWYRSLSSGKARRLLAERIAGAFIRQGSENEINISTRQRDSILSTLQLTSTSSSSSNRDEAACSPTLFCEAEQECIQLINSNLWSAFTATADYRLCAWICTYLDVNVAVDTFALDLPAADHGDGGPSQTSEASRFLRSTGSMEDEAAIHSGDATS